MACSTCTSPPTKPTGRPGRHTSRATHHRRPTSWQVPPELQLPAHRLEMRLSRTCACMQSGFQPDALGIAWAHACTGAGATITGGRVTVEGCGSDSLQGDVRFAEVMGLMGATVEWAPYAITITGAPAPHLGLLRWRASERPNKRCATHTTACLGQFEHACGSSPAEATIGNSECTTHADTRSPPGTCAATMCEGAYRPVARRARGRRS